MDQPIKVLIVEDEFLISLSISASLRRLGYEVCELVSSGERAIDQAARDQPDIILMDLGLSGVMDGLTAAHHIYASTPIPILFMTGYYDSCVRDDMLALKPVACLAKPVLPLTIHNLIQTYFNLCPPGSGSLRASPTAAG